MTPFIDGCPDLGIGRLIPRPGAQTLRQFDPKKDHPDQMKALMAEVAETGWHRMEVPTSRAGLFTDGMSRAEWCLDNFGPCALIENEPEHVGPRYRFDPTKTWAAFHDRDHDCQLFFFKDDREATLFRICRG